MPFPIKKPEEMKKGKKNPKHKVTRQKAALKKMMPPVAAK